MDGSRDIALDTIAAARKTSPSKIQFECVFFWELHRGELSVRCDTLSPHTLGVLTSRLSDGIARAVAVGQANRMKDSLVELNWHRWTLPRGLLTEPGRFSLPATVAITVNQSIESVTDLFPLPPGLVAVTGEEGSGKTRLLRRLGEGLSALWFDLSLPGRDDEAPGRVWAALRQRCPLWSMQLQQDLIEALDLHPHLGKKLSMLSTGTRRKVALVGLLASGMTVTCLDQPFAALDAASARVIREFLADVADHATRTWVVADYEADARLPWRRLVSL